jgi:tetratricopeptide (TPR) repeat protein/SAM-dependent methyltransferase
MRDILRTDPRFSEAFRNLEQAAFFQRHGQFAEAEKMYSRVIKKNPEHFDALHRYGLFKYQQGHFNDALKLVVKATKTNPRSANALNSLGIILAHLQRHEEALASFDAALKLEPNHVMALGNRSNSLNELERYLDAISSSDRASAIDPNYSEAYIPRGAALFFCKRYMEALESYDRSIKLNPNLAEAWLGRGNVFTVLMRYDEARLAYRRALDLKADFSKALSALALLSLSEGNIAEALDLARRALAANEAHETKFLVASCLCSPLLHPGMGDLRGLLLQALSEPWTRPADLAPNCARFLVLNDAIREGMARAAKAWPHLLPIEELAGPAGLAGFTEDPLLRALLESTPVCDITLERLATGLRFTLLAAARSAESTVAGPDLSFYCALARQCFINDYAFAESDAEIEWARALRDGLVAALASGAAIPVLSVVAVAAYMPLHTLPGAKSLLDRSWPDALRAVLAQQIRAPIDEQRSRASMPILTAIDDEVSMQVRDQYEENPYPRWVKTATAGNPQTVDAFIRERFPQSPFKALGKNGSADVLVAGCGTGQHPIDTARQFKAARVLAIDLSLTSLCYAQRQTRALGLNNISYAQADIMNLPSIGRSFDVIETGGVLHHLADPLAGWRGLLSMLRPGGIMRLGFYSEIARRDILVARDFIAERGYRPTAHDIRRCRQELSARPDGTALKNVTLTTDFFSLSNCRDLLFHIQEHRLTLPVIATFLGENNLQFLGFDLDLEIRRNYARQFPGDIAMTDLAQWHRYEIDNPRTFAQMYQFWVQGS